MAIDRRPCAATIAAVRCAASKFKSATATSHPYSCQAQRDGLAKSGSRTGDQRYTSTQVEKLFEIDASSVHGHPFLNRFIHCYNLPIGVQILVGDSLHRCSVAYSSPRPDAITSTVECQLYCRQRTNSLLDNPLHRKDDTSRLSASQRLPGMVCRGGSGIDVQIAATRPDGAPRRQS